MKKYIHGWHIYLTVTFVLLGILISTQIQTQHRLMSDLSMQTTSDLSIMLKNLTEAANNALEIKPVSRINPLKLFS